VNRKVADHAPRSSSRAYPTDLAPRDVVECGRRGRLKVAPPNAMGFLVAQASTTPENARHLLNRYRYLGGLFYSRMYVFQGLPDLLPPVPLKISFMV
jgi:hypothetical protein